MWLDEARGGRGTHYLSVQLGLQVSDTRPHLCIGTSPDYVCDHDPPSMALSPIPTSFYELAAPQAALPMILRTTRLPPCISSSCSRALPRASSRRTRTS